MRAGTINTPGIRWVSYAHQTHSEFMDYLCYGKSYNPNLSGETFMKMYGKKIHPWFIINMKSIIADS